MRSASETEFASKLARGWVFGVAPPACFIFDGRLSSEEILAIVSRAYARHALN